MITPDHRQLEECVELLVVRHGVAEDKEKFAESGEDDSLRPLTKEGKWKMEHVAKGLRRTLPSINVMASSPFTRALQTAKIVGAIYGESEIERLDALVPTARPQTFLTWLRKREQEDRVAVVGHEPHLGALVGWLLSGEAVEGRIVMRKGGACLLEFDEKPRAGKAKLIWSLTPAMLRRLSE